MTLALNIGSGQRRFTSTSTLRWVNVDVCSRPPDQVPDVITDGGRLPFSDGCARYAVLHQCAEHFGCGEAPFAECYRVLAPGGSLLVFIPDIRALAQRWLTGQISDFIYIVNLMGAYQGEEGDRHRWHYTEAMLREELHRQGPWSQLKRFDWRIVPGADFARDWWVLAYEGVK